ncbi:MAG: hypothetical protein Q9M26_07095 [Mariprofundales bacterium]|nr:hypothetical protein [Mariprofundales bacterium]
MEEYLSRGEATPPPSPMQHYATLAEFSGWLWAVIDAAAKREGESRSGFLARSAVMRIEHAMQSRSGF